MKNQDTQREKASSNAEKKSVIKSLRVHDGKRKQKVEPKKFDTLEAEVITNTEINALITNTEINKDDTASIRVRIDKKSLNSDSNAPS
jgi:hypothetical protein